MNNITNITIPKDLRSGDIVVFWGGHGNIISFLIESFTKGGPSHVAMVETVDSDGTVWITESTIESGVSGVQRRKLLYTLIGYPDNSSAAVLYLSNATRARADLSVITPLTNKFYGKGYNVWGLFKDAFGPTAIRELETDKKFVCSQWVAFLTDAAKITIGVNPTPESPGEILSFIGVYSDKAVLLGKPNFKNFYLGFLQ